jgi:Flp pilus assembly protein TadD
MKKNVFYLGAALLTVAMLSACGGLGKMEKYKEELGAKSSPDPLEMHGDSISLTITGRFPEKYFHRKVVAETTPVLVYSGGETAFKMKGFQGEKAVGNYEVIPYKAGKSFSYTDNIAYKPGMEVSDLQLRIKGSKGSKNAEFDPMVIGKGVIITPYLMKNDDKAIFSKDAFVRTTPGSTQAQFNYDYNSSVLKPAELKQADITALSAWFDSTANNPKIVVKNIEIMSYASPEGEILLNDNLAVERASTGQKGLMDMLTKKKIDAQYNALVKLNPKGEDWEGFRQAMEKSNIEDRDIIIRILQKTTDLASREQEIKNISKTYTEIQKDIFPSLRRSLITISYDLEGYSDAELLALGKSNPDQLKLEEILKAATLTENLNEKLAMYNAAKKNFPNDYRAHNNAGVCLYQQNKVNDAQSNFQKAYELKKAPEVANNMGIISRLNGDRKGAMTYFNEAGNAGNEVSYNKGLIHIQNGDYGSAVSNMSKYTTMNSALAKMLNGDNAGAGADIASSNDSSAIADYFRAVLDARNGDCSAAASNLVNAIQKDGSLKDKATKDLEFRNCPDAVN